jgi:hypothetical protein
VEFIDHLAALIPPPRLHRHRYHGLLAPNARCVWPPPPEVSPPAAAAPSVRSPAHYLWAMLLARLLEPLPLVCSCCGADMRIVAFITETVRRILTHIGEPAEPPRIAPARGPPAWDDPPVDLVPSRSSTVTDRTRPAATETPSRALAFSPLVW